MRLSADTRDILVISVGFLFLFTAFNALQNLQSSLNSEGRLGVVSLSVVYLSLITSCLVTPPALIHRLGCKRTMVLSMACYLPYFAANFYPIWATMIPASVILGVGAAPLWASKCAYLTVRAGGHCGATIGRYFSIFFALFQSGQVWGNLVSSLVLGQAPSADRVANASYLLYCGAGSCHGEPDEAGGATAEADAYKPPRSTVYTVLGVYTGCSVLGLLLVATLVRPLKDELKRAPAKASVARLGSRGPKHELGTIGGDERLSCDGGGSGGSGACDGVGGIVAGGGGAGCCDSSKTSGVDCKPADCDGAACDSNVGDCGETAVDGAADGEAASCGGAAVDGGDSSEGGGAYGEGWCRLFLATVRHMRDRRQLLLIPLTVYSGLEQAFLAGDFTKSMVTCALGLEWIGFVMICYGAVDSVASYGMGRMAQLLGQPALFLLASLTNVSLLVTMYMWAPRPDHAAVLFVMAALWGVADAVWQTQLNALYGILFSRHKEAAFANYRLWESLGFAAAFAYSGVACFTVKMAVMLTVLTLGLGLYGVMATWGKRWAAGGKRGATCAASVPAK